MKYSIFFGSSMGLIQVYGSGVEVTRDGAYVNVVSRDGSKKFPIDLPSNPARRVEDINGTVVWLQGVPSQKESSNAN